MSLRSKTFEILPALSVRRSELRKSLRYVTMGWMMGIVWMSAIGGSNAKSFARMLGFDDFAFGIMAAMPFLATFGQIPTALIVERTGVRKYLFVYCVLISRIIWLFVAAIPLLPIPSPLAVTVMLVLLGVSWFLAAMGGPPWFSWMGDLIPRRIRGRYMAHRNRLSGAIQVGVVILLGVVLDWATVDGAPETALAQPRLLLVCSLAFVVAGILGTGDILVFFRIRDVMPRSPDRSRPPVAEEKDALTDWVVNPLTAWVVDPLRDRAFRGYVLFATAVTFSASVAGWYYWLNALENLGFSKLAANAAFMVIGPIAGMVTSTAWGKLIDRWGRRPVLFISTIGTMGSVVPWLLATRHTPHPAFIDGALNWVSLSLSSAFGWHVDLGSPGAPIGAFMLAALGCIIGGTAWTGVGLAQTSVMLGFQDGPGRSKYVASSAVLIGIGGTLGGLVGGVVAEKLSWMQAQPWGPLLWNNWHMTFILSLLARVAALAFLIGMPDPGAGRVRDLFKEMGANVYNVVNPRLFYRIRTIGWGRRHD